MSTTSNSVGTRPQYHPEAYQFIFAALRHTQQLLDRSVASGPEDEDAHISGRELLEGVRELALEQFGLMTNVVFRQWGIHATEDFGRIVFELVERGEMRKTDRDQLKDFIDIYNFEEVFDRGYEFDTGKAFQN